MCAQTHRAKALKSVAPQVGGDSKHCLSHTSALALTAAQGIDCACRYVAHPQQSNGYDCGVFTAMFASQLAFSTDLSVIQQLDMPEFRHFIAVTVIQQTDPGILLHSPGGSSTGAWDELFGLMEADALVTE